MIQRINLSRYPHFFKAASTYLRLNQIDNAQSYLQKAVQLNPSSYSSYINLAYINHLKKKYNESITLCDVAINMKPYCGEGYYNRCLSLLMLGQQNQDSALEDIKCALSCEYLQKFKSGHGIQALQKAISYSQYNLEALRLIICFSQGNKEKYTRLLQKNEEKYILKSQKGESVYESSAQNGIFRLHDSNEKNQETSLHKLNQLLLQYKVLKEQKIEKMEKNYQSKLSLQHQILQIQIFPGSLSQYSYKNSHQKLQETSIDQSRRHSDHILPLNQLTNITESRFSLIDNFKSPLKHARDSFYDSLSSSKYCHVGCSKCKRQSQSMPVIPSNSMKMEIKTVQIYRNENIYQPKPYLIIYDGQGTHITEVDYQGGHFPKWNQIFHLRKDAENPYIIELWHKNFKQNQDWLIGTAVFEKKYGRIKCYFRKKHGGQRINGYIFLQLGK